MKNISSEKAAKLFGTDDNNRGKPYEWHSLFMDLEIQEDAAARDRATIDGFIAGRKPFTDEEAEELGVTNMNDLKMGDTMELLADGYFDLSHAVRNRITLNIKPISEDVQTVGPIVNDWAVIVAEEFDELLNSWTGWEAAEETSINLLTTHGYGNFGWEVGKDWRPSPLPVGGLLVPRKSGTDVNEWPLCFTRNTITVSALKDILENENALENGWNVELIKEFLDGHTLITSNEEQAEYAQLVERANQTDNGSETSKEEEAEQDLQSKELKPSLMPWDSIALINIYENRGADGVDHFIQFKATEYAQGFLFKHGKAFENMSQAVSITILRQPNNDRYHAVQGWGAKVFNIEVENLMLRNRARDRAKIASSIITKFSGEASASEPIIDFNSPFIQLPREVELAQQGNMNQGLGELMSMIRTFGSDSSNKSKVWSNKLDELSSYTTPRSAQELQANEVNASKIQRTYVSKFYNQRDKFFQEMFRRVLAAATENSEELHMKLAKEFMESCEVRGVPKVVFDSKQFKLKVLCTRAIGNGSEAERRLNLRSIEQISGEFTQAGRQQFTRDLTASYVGHGEANKYLGQPEGNLPNHNIFTVAVMENAGMAAGLEIPIHPDQQHLEFLELHLQAFSNPPQMDPIELYQFGARLLQHMGLHYEAGLRKPIIQQQIKSFEPVLKGIEGQLKGMEPLVKQALQQRQAQSGQLSEEARIKIETKRMELEGELMLKIENMVKKHSVKDREADHRIALRERKAARND